MIKVLKVTTEKSFKPIEVSIRIESLNDLETLRDGIAPIDGSTGSELWKFLDEEYKRQVE